MHDYSIDRHPKEKILFALAFIAISFAPFLNRVIALAVEYLSLNGAWSWGPVTAVPVFGLFLLIYFIFDRYVWKIKYLRKVLLVPDLNGVWNCTAVQTLKNGTSVRHTWEGTVTISQSWSKILVHLQTSQSRSNSVAASISRIDGIGYRLLYQYANDPVAGEHDLNIHAGTAELTFDKRCTSGSGYYFTDQHRQTVGQMTLRRGRHGK